LINAIQYLAIEWMYKPLGLVSYGGVSAGLGSANALRIIATSNSMMPLPGAGITVGQDMNQCAARSETGRKQLMSQAHVSQLGARDLLEPDAAPRGVDELLRRALPLHATTHHHCHARAEVSDIRNDVSGQSRNPIERRHLWNFVTVSTHRGRGVHPRLLDEIVRREAHAADAARWRQARASTAGRHDHRDTAATCWRCVRSGRSHAPHDSPVHYQRPRQYPGRRRTCATAKTRIGSASAR